MNQQAVTTMSETTSHHPLDSLFWSVLDGMDPDADPYVALAMTATGLDATDPSVMLAATFLRGARQGLGTYLREQAWRIELNGNRSTWTVRGVHPGGRGVRWQPDKRRRSKE